MPIDTSILSGLKPLQIESPMNQLGKMYELQNAQQANQLGALKMQEAQRSMGANEQLRQLYGQGVDETSPDFLRQLGAISPEARRAQMEFMQKQALNQSTITRNNAQAASAGLTGEKAKLDRAKTLTDMGVSILGGATDEASYQRSLAQLKIIGGDTSQLPTSYDKTRVQEFINKGLSHKDQLAAQDRALDEKIAKEFTTPAVAPLGAVDQMLPPGMQTGVTSPGAPASMDFAGMARAKLAARPGDPQALALLQATQPKFAFQNTQNKIVPIQTNALAPGYAPPQPMAMGMSPFQTGSLINTVRGQDMTAGTALAGQGVTMRGQNMTAGTALAGQGVTMRGQDMRQANATNMSAPVAIVGPDGKPIYTTREGSIGQTPAASMEGLTPKEIQKREAAFPQSQASFKSIENSGRSLIADMTALRDHPGLASITGIAAGRLPGFTPEGRAAQALYDKIVAKGGFQMLQDLRNASKTGGALGNVSNQEGSQLKSAFAAIDRKQEAKDVMAALDEAITNTQGSMARTKEAFDTTYEYKTGAKPSANPHSGKTDAEIKKELGI